MIRRFLILNGLAISAVAMQHAAAYGHQAMFEWTDRYLPVIVPNYDLLGSPAYYFLMFLRLLLTGALPAFYFVSGYFLGFLGRGGETSVRWNTMLPRVKMLLIPFAAWTLVRFMLARQLPKTLDDILNPYHFIPVLIQFYLLAPLLIAAARRNWPLLLLVMAALQLIAPGVRYVDALGYAGPVTQAIDAIPRWIFLVNHVFWFPFGVVAGLHLHRYTAQLIRYRRPLLIAAVLLGLMVIIEYELLDYANGETWLGGNFAGIVRHPYSLALILAFLAYDKVKLPFSKELAEIGTKSLGVYLANIPFVYAAAYLMYHLTPALLGYHLIYFIILFAAGLGVPLLLMSLVRTSPARLGYRYLFG